jgi:hypothetical protein
MSEQQYCTSCGSRIPDGQGKSCSMCYGDPYWGRDGYYLAYLEQQHRAAEQEPRP